MATPVRVGHQNIEVVVASRGPVRVGHQNIEVVVGGNPVCLPPPNTDPSTAIELACPSGTLDGDACGTDFVVWFRFDPVGPTSITFTVVTSNGQAYLTGETATDDIFEDIPAGEYTFEITETTWVQLYTDVPGPYSIAWECCTLPANDDWANAEVLVGSSGSVIGTTVCATVEPDEPGLS